MENLEFTNYNWNMSREILIFELKRRKVVINDINAHLNTAKQTLVQEILKESGAVFFDLGAKHSPSRTRVLRFGIIFFPVSISNG